MLDVYQGCEENIWGSSSYWEASGTWWLLMQGELIFFGGVIYDLNGWSHIYEHIVKKYGVTSRNMGIKGWGLSSWYDQK